MRAAWGIACALGTLAVVVGFVVAVGYDTPRVFVWSWLGVFAGAMVALLVVETVVPMRTAPLGPSVPRTAPTTATSDAGPG